MKAVQHKQSVLERIRQPHDLKHLNKDELIRLASELRSFILDVVSVHPGHLGASLGVVELTIALHYVFNAPHDKIIWDVGHQAYGHKILTGRKERFHTLRQRNGISGFPSPEESPYDAFTAGHASTALSALLGMAEAAKLKGVTDIYHVAVIGDGGLTGGETFEAFNNIRNNDVLIVLNDNGIAIDENSGAVDKYLKNMVQYPQTNGKQSLFEAMGITYFGPVDGHDIPLLISVLKKAKKVSGPKLLHVLTVKGKGFKKAEQDQTTFHAPGMFDRTTGEIVKKVQTKKTYPEVFGESVTALAAHNPSIAVVTPAMITGSSLTGFRRLFKNRLFDTGIAEQHAVTFSAGLSAAGLKPFCTIYSTFLQRAYDQIIHDVALPSLPVVFAIDRAGLTGEDGATHQGVFDMAFLRSVPNMVVSAPMDGETLRNMVFTASKYQKGPFAIRYSKNDVPDELPGNFSYEPVEIGKGRMISEGEEIVLLTLGYAGVLAQQALFQLHKENIFPAHYDLRFLKPLDEFLLLKAFETFRYIVTIEDGILKGGLSDAVVAFKEKHGLSGSVLSLGVPDQFIPHASRPELYEYCGYGVNSIRETVKKLLRTNSISQNESFRD